MKLACFLFSKLIINTNNYITPQKRERYNSNDYIYHTFVFITAPRPI